MALGSTQLLTEMSTRNLLGGKGRPARGADTLTFICEPLSRKCGSLDVSTLWAFTACYRDNFCNLSCNHTCNEVFPAISLVKMKLWYGTCRRLFQTPSSGVDVTSDVVSRSVHICTQRVVYCRLAAEDTGLEERTVSV
jgi:hypothetical protein